MSDCRNKNLYGVAKPAIAAIRLSGILDDSIVNVASRLTIYWTTPYHEFLLQRKYVFTSLCIEFMKSRGFKKRSKLNPKE